MTAMDVEHDLVDRLLAKRSVSDDDVLALRGAVFRDGVIDQGEAEMVFRLERECPEKGDTWSRFYVDALTDYFVWRREPRGYIDEPTARFLIDRLMDDGHVAGETELALLVNIVHWSKAGPEVLRLFALEAVRDSVLCGATAVYGKVRRPRVIDPVDMEIIRKVVYAESSEGGFTISRREAELLFALNHATLTADNDPGWRDLFAKAVGNYLMFPQRPPEVPTAQEELRREHWLRERRGVGGFFRDMGRAAGRRDVSLSAAWDELDLFGRRSRRDLEEREAERASEASQREAVDEGEARWLLERLSEDGRIDDNERALLRFIRENATAIHPALEPVLEQVGV